MDKIKLSVKQRDSRKPRLMRREGHVPATLYGPGQDSENVQIDAREFSRLPVSAYSHMIELDFGGKAPVNAVIRHVQRKSTKHEVMHVEFYRVRLDRKLTMSVPLKYVGSSVAVTVQGGQVAENFQEVEVECLPGELPDFIEVDISSITEIEGSIHIEDLKVPAGVKLLNPHDEVVVRVISSRSSEPGAGAAGAATAGATEATAASAAS